MCQSNRRQWFAYMLEGLIVRLVASKSFSLQSFKMQRTKNCWASITIRTKISLQNPFPWNHILYVSLQIPHKLPSFNSNPDITIHKPKKNILFFISCVTVVQLIRLRVKKQTGREKKKPKRIPIIIIFGETNEGSLVS